MGIDRQVKFLGRLTRTEVLKELVNCDAFVLSSIIETFGVVVIEALACGKPVVATVCGGPEGIVTAENGILVPIKDVEALADGMKTVSDNIANYESVKIRKECISKYGEKAIASRLSEIYQKVEGERLIT